MSLKFIRHGVPFVFLGFANVSTNKSRPTPSPWLDFIKVKTNSKFRHCLPKELGEGIKSILSPNDIEFLKAIKIKPSSKACGMLSRLLLLVLLC